MRIDIIIPKIYTTPTKAAATSQAPATYVSLPQNVNTQRTPGLGYFVSFSGYKEDKIFISEAKQALDNTMQNIISYYEEDNYEFTDALDILRQNNNEKYQKVTNSDFKTYEEEFNRFNEITLNSIKDVQYGKSQFGKFWCKNSRIGKQKTIDIINQAINAVPTSDINEILKSLDYEQSEKLRQKLIIEWFKYETEHLNNSKDFIHNENKELYKSLKRIFGTNKTKQFLTEQESYYTNEFNKVTIDKILDNKAPKEQRLEAVNTILSYLEDQLKMEDTDNLKSHLNKILKVQKHLKEGIDKESFKFAEDDFKVLYDIAISDWQKHSLPTLINNSLKKVIFIKETETKTPVMTTIPGYSELSLTQKYFVAKYYEANNNGLKDNMLKQIIQDRDIQDPSVVIDTISLKIESDRQKYFNQIDTFYDYLRDRQQNPDLKIPEIEISHRKGLFSFIDQYLYELEKFEDYSNKPTKDKLNYLSTLTKDELRIANEKIKQNWDENELQYLIETEVRKQAKYTSINTKMYEELQKININLNDIKIKIDNISFSLKDLLDNKYILKDETEIKKAIQNSSTVLADAERSYFAKSPQEQAETDLKIKETMPIVIDNLIQKTDDRDIIEQLTFIKTKCKEPKTKSHELFNMLKIIAIGRAMGMGMNKSYNGLGHLFKSHGNLHNITYASLTDAPDPADIIQDTTFGDVGIQALQSVSLGTAAHTATQSSYLGGIFTAIPPIEPVTAAIIITLAATAGSTVIATTQANKLARQQRELYVEFSR